MQAAKIAGAHLRTQLHFHASELGLPVSDPSVLAKTRKGKGVSFMENVAKWHHGVPNDDEFNRAIAELEAAEIAIA